MSIPPHLDLLMRSRSAVKTAEMLRRAGYPRTAFWHARLHIQLRERARTLAKQAKAVKP